MIVPFNPLPVTHGAGFVLVSYRYKHRAMTTGVAYARDDGTLHALWPSRWPSDVRIFGWLPLPRDNAKLPWALGLEPSDNAG